MNVKLRVELLARLWHMLDRGVSRVTEQELYGVPVTARIEPIYSETLRKFLETTLPYVSRVTDDETRLITYEFPPQEDCVRHIINEVLLKNRTTFVRFYLAAYCTQDNDSTVSSAELMAHIFAWARRYDVATEYIPVAQHSLTMELEALGYVKCRMAQGAGFWGVRLNG